MFVNRGCRPTIIAVTAVNVDGEVATQLDKYADGVLTKPIVEIERLGQALKNIK
jgi:CheY-like chemotaxis protein